MYSLLCTPCSLIPALISALLSLLSHHCSLIPALQSLLSTPEYLVLAHWMLCCPVGYVERKCFFLFVFFFVDFFCGHCLWTHFVDTICWHFLLTLFLETFCGHFGGHFCGHFLGTKYWSAAIMVNKKNIETPPMSCQDLSPESATLNI